METPKNKMPAESILSNGSIGQSTTPITTLLNSSKDDNGYLLRVKKIHAQLIFAIPIDAEKFPYQFGPDRFVRIDFNEAVRGLRFYCSDLSDWIREGDKILASEIVKEEESDDEQNYRLCARSVEFDFDIADRLRRPLPVTAAADNAAAAAAGDRKENETNGPPPPSIEDEYIRGRGRVTHVGDQFALVQADDRSGDQRYHELLMPITALTRDRVSSPCKNINHPDFVLKDEVHIGDLIIYKVLKLKKGENVRTSGKIISARLRDDAAQLAKICINDVLRRRMRSFGGQQQRK